MAFSRFGKPTEKPNLIDVHALALRQKSKKRVMFDLGKQTKQIELLLGDKLPAEDEVYKILSGKEGFSSIAIIEYVARHKRIERLEVSTFAIGKAQAAVLEDLSRRGRLGDVSAIVSSLLTSNDAYESVIETFKRNGWSIALRRNHSKLILMRCEDGACYVCETSSNLNENPNVEQYSFEQSAELHSFYSRFLEAFGGEADGES